MRHVFVAIKRLFRQQAGDSPVVLCQISVVFAFLLDELEVFAEV